MPLNIPTRFLIILLTSCQIGQYIAVHIVILPEKENGLNQQSVNISCLPSVEDIFDENIFLIELYKGGERPLVFIRHGSQLSYSYGNGTRFVAKARLGKDVSQSYLNMTIVDPQERDEGKYTCVMFSVDDTGLVKQRTDSKELRIKNSSSTKENTSLLQKISHLEEELATQNSILLERISVLEETTTNQSQKISGLGEKANYRSAFFATRNGPFTYGKGQTIVFSKVMMKDGDGYDDHTGLFTSPCNGLYNFNLIAQLRSSGSTIWIDLMKNDRLITRLKASDKDYSDQTSVGVVMNLKKGDIVKTVVNSMAGNGELLGHPHSSFSGYLIQPV